jgi:hypothetical protein
LLGSARSTANERGKLFDGETRLADEGPKRTLGDLSVVGDREATVGRLRVPEDDVAAPLPVKLVPELAERGSDLAPRDAR